jgi:stress response protein SCP2
MDYQGDFRHQGAMGFSDSHLQSVSFKIFRFVSVFFNQLTKRATRYSHSGSGQGENDQQIAIITLNNTVWKKILDSIC